MPDAFDTVNVRYMVGDVQEAVDWYVGHFGFSVILASPAFGSVERGHLRLLLSGKASSAGRPMPDGRQPEPGGWNRFQVITDDIATEAERLRGRGVKFRNEIISGPGGSQVLLEDPSGNVVELFQPAAAFQASRR
jgi:catechol 2,3-dioxygenase-like lactoylglutathione lyase family enzyme